MFVFELNGGLLTGGREVTVDVLFHHQGSNRNAIICTESTVLHIYGNGNLRVILRSKAYEYRIVVSTRVLGRSCLAAYLKARHGGNPRGGTAAGAGIHGFAFENLVVNHYRELLPFLHLGETAVFSAAPYRKVARKKGAGLQIDLLIQTRKSVCVVEIKRRERIDDWVVEDVREKVRRLPVKAGMSVRTALVYAGKLASAVREDGYFDFIVPVEDLFEGT